MEATSEEKERLNSLLVWKRRLLSSSEDEINECFLNMNELLSIIPFTDADSPSRRSGLCILEKLTLICWQNSQYGKRPLQSSQLSFIEAVYPVIEKLAKSIEFDTSGFWFGGIDKNRSEKFSCNKSAFVSLCLHLIALSTPTSCSSVETFFSSLTRFYNKSYDFSMDLIEHDERCLSTTVALMHIDSEKIFIPDQYDPRRILICIFAEIDFDHSVVLDWLSSEIVAIPFMLRFLKDLQTHLDLYNISSVDFPIKKVASQQPEQKITKCDGGYVLQLFEKHGEKLATNVFKFPKSETPSHEKKPSAIQYDSPTKRNGQCYESNPESFTK
uniref:Uncharacterized protein n=1 Tax=Syphacia muris TaxID=451379 RepID=A0A0N5AS43_9BILA